MEMQSLRRHLFLRLAEAQFDGQFVRLNRVDRLEQPQRDQRQLQEGSSTAAGYSRNPYDWSYMNRGSNQDIGVGDASHERRLRDIGVVDYINPVNGPSPQKSGLPNDSSDPSPSRSTKYSSSWARASNGLNRSAALVRCLITACYG